MFKIKNKDILIITIFLFLTSRIIIYFAGIHPNHEIFATMWQVLDLNLLEKNFFSSIYYLHYQPPLWNFIIGLIVQIFEADYLTISKVIHLINIIISMISIIIFFKLSEILKLSRFSVFLISLFLITISLSYIFYENYLHYTHLTTLFFLLFIYNYFRFVEKFELKYEIYIYLVATSLVYTWSAFSHPFFICLIFTTICFIKLKFQILRSIIIFLLFILISALPSIKNKIELNFFGNSSWIGLQIIQVLQRWDVYNGACNMNFDRIYEYEKLYKDDSDINFNHPSLVGKLSKWNNIGMIYKTKKCLNKGIELILEDPINYVSIVKFNFISTHGHFAFDHGFKPIGWNQYFNIFDKVKKYKFSNFLKVRFIQIYYVITYIFFTTILIRSLIRIKDATDFSYGKAMSSIFLIYLWMIILTHMFAGFEQERMRHIGHFLHVLFLSLVLKEKFNFKKLFTKNY